MSKQMTAEEAHTYIRDAASCPLVDHHCHNLVATDSSIPYSNFLTEADGDAIDDAVHSIHFKRNVRDIATLFGVEPSVASIEKYRREKGVPHVTEMCLKAGNIAALLIDDGLLLDKMHPLEWHRGFCPVVKRVLRLETVAQQILATAPSTGSVWSLDTFEQAFLQAIDPPPESVVSFKSITAYRCGLRVDPVVSRADAEAGLSKSLEACKGGPLRLTDQRILNFIFVKGLEVATKHGIPTQIHTGFGDKDLDLLLANPLHLRGVLEDPRFATAKLVLLHTSYPYCREVSYLATVYKQVYLDFGLVFHKLSHHGMQQACHEILHMAPLSKVMYSGDGSGLAETYYLGAKWGREILCQILCEMYDGGDLTAQEARAAAQDILMNNAIRIYGLPLDPVPAPLPLVKSGGTGADELAKAGPPPKAVRLLFVDLSGQRRARVVPWKRYSQTVAEYGVGVTHAIAGCTSFQDGIAPGSGLTSVGEVALVPDASTRRKVPWFPQHDVVVAEFHRAPGVAWEMCGRSALTRMCTILEAEFGFVVRAAWECEFYLFKETSPKLIPVDQGNYCSTGALGLAEDFLQDTSDALEALGVEVEQMHPESGPGQHEIAYAHRPAVEAADSVLLLRETVCALAQKRGLHATFLPSVLEDQIGSGAHIHVSLNRDGDNAFGQAGTRFGLSPEGASFMAGVLHHLPGLVALSCPHPNSYARLKPQKWAGAFQCWGPENKEAAIRASQPPGSPAGHVTNFELKAMDACANPYLALAGLMAAGLDGLRTKMELPEPIMVDPADLPSGHSVQRLPSSLTAAVQAFEADAVLKEAMGPILSTAIIAVRKAEEEHFRDIPFADAVKELIFRY
eukprot:TRINITY_DN13675_c0_g1_i1.p1 TRINITY_DN13675_c0_g1~~TRINITY_DN13675_c0_g1_i1.p1  ORF type:complete len:850 (+),score=166.67 TRINITY_DN13675_c0_g1_i1:407-2956(+)